MGCDSHGGGRKSGWWLLWVVVAGCYEFFVRKFYFILISCLYYFKEKSVNIEVLMFGVLKNELLK